METASLEAASNAAQIAVVVLGLLAGVAGVAAYYFSARVSDRKDAAFERFKTQSAATIANADARAAEAKAEAAKSLLEAAAARERSSQLELQIIEQRHKISKEQYRIQWLERSGWPRWDMFRRDDFVAALKGAPKGDVEILFQADDEEASALARRIFSSLRDAGWNRARLSENYGKSSRWHVDGTIRRSFTAYAAKRARRRTSFRLNTLKQDRRCLGVYARRDADRGSPSQIPVFGNNGWPAVLRVRY